MGMKFVKIDGGQRQIAVAAVEQVQSASFAELYPLGSDNSNPSKPLLASLA